jgi:hypothetical protein
MIVRKKITTLIMLISILFLLLCTLMPSSVSAHSPSHLKLDYDHDTNALQVTITHLVEDPNVHYVYKIDILKNGAIVHTENYDSQPSNEKFVYLFVISADEDDTLKVTAYCNQGGELSGSLELAIETTSETDDDSPELWPFHSLPMLIGFILMATGIGIAKVMKKKKWWLKAHKSLNSIGSLLAIIGLFIAIYMVSESGGAHFSVSHALLGGVTIALLILSPILGFVIMKGGKHVKIIRTTHRWLGRIAITLMLIAMIMGYSLVGVL